MVGLQYLQTVLLKLLNAMIVSRGSTKLFILKKIPLFKLLPSRKTVPDNHIYHFFSYGESHISYVAVECWLNEGQLVKHGRSPFFCYFQIEGIMHAKLLWTMLVIHRFSVISRLQVVVGTFLRFSVFPPASERNARKAATAI